MRNTKRTIGTLLKKPSTVEVIRYFRPYDSVNQQISNLGGMTAICILNYDEMNITVHPSFCMDTDNFDKVKGKYYAEVNATLGNGFVVAMDKDVSISDNIFYEVFNNSVLWLNDFSEKAYKAPLIRMYKSLYDN